MKDIKPQVLEGQQIINRISKKETPYSDPENLQENQRLNGEELKAFPLMLGTRQG